MSSLPSSGRLLALDWGEVRIGLALSDETQTLATPLGYAGAPRGQAVSHAAAAGAGRRARARSAWSSACRSPVKARKAGAPIAARELAESRPAAPACRWSCGTSG